MYNTLITLDVDWVPDFVIDWVAEILIEHGVCATWFLTNKSIFLEQLDINTPFELGIHPNFLPGSSQGDSPDEVLEYCMNLLPDARSMRTHALVQSTQLLAKVISQTPVANDVSLLLPHATGLQPVLFNWQGKELIRIPYFWEDDIEMERSHPIWELQKMKENFNHNGIEIYNFHPIHIYLNSDTMVAYNQLKLRAGGISSVQRNDFDGLINPGKGTRSMFLELVKFLSEIKGDTVDSFARRWKTGGGLS